MGSANIWIKRDDLTGCLLSGNKVRKLEFVVQDAIEKESQVLVTCGGLQSNHARTTAALAARLGLKCHLVLKGTQPREATGNYLLDHVLGVDTSFITAEEYSSQNREIMEKIAAHYAMLGLKAYVIPEGASCALGTFGYAQAIDEILHQCKIQKLKIDAIICATGSGGTQAGLILGTKIYDVPIPIYGINICDNAEYFENKIYHILADVKKEFIPELGFTRDDIHLIDGYVGDGYGKARPEELNMLKDFARCEGIVLEPVYTGKAMYGLAQEIKRGNFQQAKNILFIHTGGIFGLYPFSDQLTIIN